MACEWGERVMAPSLCSSQSKHAAGAGVVQGTIKCSLDVESPGGHVWKGLGTTWLKLRAVSTVASMGCFSGWGSQFGV